jgi:hypothetical protein
MNHHSLALLALLFSSTMIVGAQTSRQQVEPEDRDISINGTIRLIHGYGPLGYGEDRKHDAHVSYWALETSIPINTPCILEKTEFASDCAATKSMKLFFQGLELKPLAQLPAARWKDKPVVVHGRIHRADTAGEMTAIYMDVSDIAPMKP